MLYSLPAYALIALAALMSVAPRYRAKVKPELWPVWATTVFLVYVVIRAWYSPIEYLARPDLYLALASLAVYLLGAFVITGSRERIWIFIGLFAFAFFQFAVGAIQFAEGNRFMPLPWIVREGYGIRASGTYICPNHYAGLMEVLGLMALSFVFWSRWSVGAKMLAAYTAMACMVGVGLSGSRGGYLSVAAGIITFMVISLCLYRQLRHGRAWFVGLGLVGIVGAALLGAVVLLHESDFLRTRFQTILETNNCRLLLWDAALKQYAQSPLWGTGSGTYLYYGRHFRSAAVQNDPVFVHNDYLHLLCEYGLVGALLCGAVLLLHINGAIRSLGQIVRERLVPGFRTTSNVLALQVGALCAVGAYVVHSVVDFNLHIPANALLMAFVFGILANNGVKKTAARVRVSSASLRWLLPVTGGVLLVVACPKILCEYYAERARVEWRDGNWVQAVEHAKRGLKDEKANPDLYFYLGDSQRNLGNSATVISEKVKNWESALEAFNKGLAVFPWDLRSLLRGAQTLDSLLRFREAEILYQRAIDADPSIANVYALYGLHFHRQGLLDLAETQYRKANKLSSDPVAISGLQEIQAARAKQKELLPK